MNFFHFLASFLIFTCLSLNAQISNVVTGLEGLEGIALKGSNLYISEDEANKISKIDISDVSPSAMDIVTGLNIPIGVMFNGNDLYICELGANKVSKINITDASPSTTDVVTGLNKPYKTILYGNDLYIIEYGANKISKIDITDETPSPVDVVTGLSNPLEILLNGTDLYIAEYGAGKVTKINITDPIPTTTTDVVVGINGPAGLSLKNNELYISGYDDGVISKIDILDPEPTGTFVVSGVYTPAVTIFKDDDLYITECEASIISKYSLPCSSSSEAITVTKCYSYTVPSTDEIYTTGGNYTVMDTIANHLGCDSVITIDLTINSVDTSVVIDGNVLTSNNSSATYQWINCNNNTIIDGATNQSYNAMVGGSYKVAVNSNNCLDTSGCKTVTVASIEDYSFNSEILVFPNPTKGSFSIDFKEKYNSINVTISDLNGKILMFNTYNEIQLLNLNFEAPAGVYLLEIESEDKNVVTRLIKE